MLKWLKHLFYHTRLRRRMPVLRGRVLEDEPLAKKTWFGVGGTADIYVEPADTDDLAHLVKTLPDEPLTILGAGSNVLVLDGGIPGITVHLGKSFSYIRVQEDRLICGAGALLKDVARVAEKNNIAGLEFLSGIPGSVGGAVRMNAGAFKQSLSDRMIALKSMTGNGDISDIDPKQMNIFEYRKCYLPEDWIFLEVILQGEKVKNGDDIRAKMQQYKKKREASQPQGVRTAGSTFKNPDGLQAWKLIDKAGLRGFRVGGAVVSEKHANFLINDKGATAADIENLGEKIREKVKKEQGVHLEWEVRRLGVRK
ncbi:MAG: UDP-N-acetylmuramate dehydrogenase [Alphaproteobacteria bacterium]|nr:UDP-N-acetylmuramate dehydrogenase [Alphaproteobacteria bacterium]